jgi:sugar fermentation stimulation protein A
MKGVYILLFRITNDLSARVGSLGVIHFEKGNYAYVGSAQSSLFPRLERHYAKKKRVHWHIDYLTTSENTSINGVIYSATDRKEMECKLSAALSTLPFSKTVPSFGSTDCKHGCKSHLFMLKSTWKHATSSIIGIFETIGLSPASCKR